MSKQGSAEIAPRVTMEEKNRRINEGILPEHAAGRGMGEISK